MSPGLAHLCLAVCLGAQDTGADGAFRFAVVGHTRGGPDNGVIPNERLDELVREVGRAAPDFLILTGDLIWGDFFAGETGRPLDEAAIRADWDAVDATFDRLGVPVRRVPGNHDLWDPVTRDVWVERYGPLESVFEFEGSSFVLMNSCWTPAPGEDRRCPGGYIRGIQHGADRLSFLARNLGEADSSEHVFVFQHHMLWWEDDAAWWRQVHPLLVRSGVRAVFAGDLGPWKFSHLERDGVHYVQSAVEFTEPPLVMRRNRESVRTISSQLDNWVLVHVDGPEVRYEVRTVGAMSAGRHRPETWREVYDYDRGTVQRKLWRRFQSPRKLLGALLVAGGGGVLGGLLVGLVAGWILRASRER